MASPMSAGQRLFVQYLPMATAMRPKAASVGSASPASKARAMRRNSRVEASTSHSRAAAKRAARNTRRPSSTKRSSS